MAGKQQIELEDVLTEFAQELIDEMRKRLLTSMMNRSKRFGAISSAQVSRNLLQAIAMQVEGSGVRARAVITMPYYAEFINEGVQGAEEVKEGAYNSPYKFKSKMPPVSVFAGASGWIARKGFNLRAMIDKKGKTKKQISEDVKKLNKRLAFIIAESVRRRGVPGYHFFDFVFETQTQERLQKLLKEKLKEEINAQIKRK